MKRSYFIRAVALLATLSLLFGGNGATPAQAQASVAIRQAILSQTLVSADLIVGKDMVALLVLDVGGNGSVNVKATANLSGKSYTASKNVSRNDNFIAVTIPGGPTQAGQTSVKVQIDTGGGVNNSAGQVSTTIKKNAIAVNGGKIKIFFLPVDWTDSLKRQYNYDKAIPTMARENFEFIKATYPLSSDSFEYDYAAEPYLLRPFESTVADDSGEINWTAITAMYASIGVVGRSTVGARSGQPMKDATIVVGVLPPKWFATHMKSPTTAGLEITSIKGTVTSAILNYIAVAGHEMGHTYGLLDDYDVSQGKTGNPIDDDGYWVGLQNNDSNLPDLQGRSPLILKDAKDNNNEPYYSFMAAVNDNPWVDSTTWNFILNAIKTGVRQ